MIFGAKEGGVAATDYWPTFSSVPTAYILDGDDGDDVDYLSLAISAIMHRLWGYLLMITVLPKKSALEYLAVELGHGLRDGFLDVPSYDNIIERTANVVLVHVDNIKTKRENISSLYRCANGVHNGSDLYAFPISPSLLHCPMSMGDVSVVYPIMVQLWRVGSSSYNICGYRTSQHATPQIPGRRGLRKKKLRNRSWSSRRR